jgi:hypothetical protein
MQRTTLRPFVTIALLLMANRVGAQGSRAPTRRDSAGIRIIEYATVKDAPLAFTLAATPWLQLGGLKPNLDEELDSKQPFLAPTRLSDGRIAVSDWASIKLFDSTGRFLGSGGRSGPGPGEFTQLRRLCRLQGDTLLAIDYSDRRVSLWTRDAKLVKAYGSAGLLASDPCFADGTLLTQRASGGRGAAPTGGFTAQFSRIRPDGTVLADLGEFPVEEFSPLVTRSPSVIPTSDRIYVADARTWEVRVQALSGKVTQIIRVHAPPGCDHR